MDLFYKSMFYKLFYTPKILGGVISNLGGDWGGIGGGLYKLLYGTTAEKGEGNGEFSGTAGWEFT